MSARRARLALACALAFLLSCGERRPGGNEAGASGGAFQSAGTAGGGAVRFRVETVVGNLEVPWSIVFKPDGRLLFKERPGRVRVFEDWRLRPEPLATIPDVEQSSKSGLKGLLLHPQFASNRQLYLAYAYKREGIRVRVVVGLREIQLAFPGS